MVVGLLLLVGGAEVLVRGASSLATSWGISSLVVGLTVVAFGTSSPELAVSVKAVLAGQAGIATGNVIGSNIFNVLFILGLSALIAPLVVSQQLIKLDVPLMIGASALIWIFALDGHLRLGEGIVLFGSLLVYILFLIRQSRKTSVKDTEPSLAAIQNQVSSPNKMQGQKGQSEHPTAQPKTTHWIYNVIMVLVGLVLLVVGSKWLVAGAVMLAERMGVSDVVIGLTVIAAGTSLPEVVTSVVASLRGERDIAVGNVVGSNLFNLLGVLGIASLIAPGGIDLSPSLIGFDLPIMTVVAFACLPIFFTGGRISRWEGAVLLAYYVAYTGYLVIANSQHDALELYSATMLYFAIPLTLITLLVIAIRERQAVGKP